MASRYPEVYAAWQRDPQAFWAEAAKEIDWIEPPRTIFDPKAGVYGRWFPDAVCNTCMERDRSPREGRARRAAGADLRQPDGRREARLYLCASCSTEVRTLAGVLQEFGVTKGDRVVIYMPMVPEALFAMLACARIGAIHSVVFGGFAAKELATRLNDAKPKLVLSASCGLEPGRTVAYKPLLDQAIELAQAKPNAVMILQRPQLQAPFVDGRDHDWAERVADARASGRATDCVPLLATDPLYILYTSGTTGVPKGVVRDNGGHMVALKWSMWNLYGTKPGEVLLVGLRHRLGRWSLLRRLRAAAAWRDIDHV